MTKEEAAAEARRAYQRAWNKKNRDKVREYQLRYWAKKAAEAKAAEQQTTVEAE